MTITLDSDQTFAIIHYFVMLGRSLKAGFIDAWGRGYKKIREGFESVGLPMPKVENFCGGVQVTFQRKNVANNSGQTSPIVDLQNVLEEKTKQLTERQKNIFNRLIETGQMSVLENVLENVLETSASLAKYFKVDARTIRRDLSVLQTKGFIRHDGPDKGGRWVVIKG